MTNYSIDRKKLKKDRKLNKWRYRKKIFKATGNRTEREELKNRDRESDRQRHRKKFFKATGYKKHRKELKSRNGDENRRKH